MRYNDIMDELFMGGAVTHELRGSPETPFTIYYAGLTGMITILTVYARPDGAFDYIHKNARFSATVDEIKRIYNGIDDDFESIRELKVAEWDVVIDYIHRHAPMTWYLPLSAR